MNKFVVLSFLFMGFAFYEMSGGDEFVPRKAEMMAAAKAEATEKAKAREARLANVRPEPVQAPIEVAETAQPEQSAPVPAPEPAAQSAKSVDEPATPVTLASLQTNSELFARPVIQLGTLRAASSVPVAEPEPEPLDIREVAGSRVNVREGPGTGYSIVASLPRGTPVEVLDSDGEGWVKLRTVETDQTGWMAEYLLTKPTG